MSKIMSIPKDSILYNWVEVLSSMTEVPESYQVLIGLSILGTLLKRRLYFDQFQWRVYPNLSVLLIGPPGIGKDTVINAGLEVIEAIAPDHPVLGGRTIEKVFLDMQALGDPAACLIPAPEIAAFLGSQDYQSGKMQDLTNLLSTNKKLDISTIGRGTQWLARPTATVWGGSTVKWLHMCMPEGSLEGGFIPRFTVISEERTGKHISMPKYMHTREENEQFTQQKILFAVQVKEIVEWWPYEEKEMFPLGAARDMFHEWYVERIKRFAPTVADYAFRARDHVLRMAMLLAVSCHRDYMGEEDVAFAIEMMDYIAQRLEKTVILPTREAACMEEILALLPAQWDQVLRLLARRYEPRIVQSAKNTLIESRQIEPLKDGKMVVIGG